MANDNVLSGLVLLLAVVAFSPFANAAVNPNVRMESFALDKESYAPGDTVTLTLRLNDTQDVCAEQVSAQMAVVGYPLSVAGPDTQYIDTLCAWDSPSKGTLAFRLPIDALASSGTYQATLATAYQKSFLKFTASNAISIIVRGKADIRASVVSSSPVDIYPGDKASLQVRVDNLGNGRADSVTLSFTSPNLEVKWAGREASLGQMAPRSTAQTSVSIEAPKSLKPGTYPLDAGASYVAEDGSRKASSFAFDVVIKPKAEFAASGPEEPLRIGETNYVPITLKNTGSQEARRLKISVIPVYPFSTDGTVRYAESLPPGASATLYYRIPVDKEAGEGDEIVTVAVAYEDEGGKKYSDTADLSLSVKPQTITETLAGYWWAGAIAIAAAFLIARRKMAGRK